jgi:hypothetical protein
MKNSQSGIREFGVRVAEDGWEIATFWSEAMHTPRGGAMRALTLLQHLEIAKAGRVDMSHVQHEIDESPEEVRTMFQTN